MLTCSLLTTAVILPGLPAADNLNVRLDLNMSELYFTLSKITRLFLFFSKKNQKESLQGSSFLLYTRWKRTGMPMGFKVSMEESKERGFVFIYPINCLTMYLKYQNRFITAPEG